MNILQLIATQSFITVNKEVIKKVGLEEAIILGELASEFDYWQKNNGLTEDGYFFSTIENIEDKTTLSEHKQRKAMKTLKDNGLLDISVRGIPAKRYIRLNDANIVKLFNIETVEKAQRKTTNKKTSSKLPNATLNINNVPLLSDEVF